MKVGRPERIALAIAAFVAPGCAAFGAIFHGETRPEPAGAVGEDVARTLPSGLQVVAQRAHATPVVALELVVAVGSADDPEDHPGAARALDESIGGDPALAAIVTGHGGRVDAWVTSDESHLAVVVPASAFDEALRALARAALVPRLAPDEVDARIGEMVDEVRRSRASPERLALEGLYAVAFAGSAWARPPVGTPESLARLRATDLRRLHRATWVPAHMTLAIAGDLESSEAIDAAERAFRGRGALPAADAPRARPPAIGTARIEAAADSSREGWIAIGFRVDDASEDELAALQIAAMLLAGRPGARVPDALEQAGLPAAAMPSAILHVTRGPALLLLWMPIGDAARTPAAVETILSEAYRLGRRPAGASELTDAKRALDAAEARGRDGMVGLAHTLVSRAASPRLAAASDPVRRRAIGAAGLRAAASRLLVPERTVAFVLVPGERLEPTRTALHGTAERAQRRAIERSAPGERTTIAGGVVREVLGNGVRVLVAEDRRAGSAAIRLALAGGARVENDSSAGSSALLARLMARAAGDVAPGGAHVEPFAGRDTFGIEGLFASSDAVRGLEALVRGLRAPALTPAAIEDERRTLGLARAASAADPTTIALRRLARVTYGTHPYAGDPAGTPEGIAALTAPRLSAFAAQTLAADRLVVVVTGDVRADRIIERAREVLGGLARGGPLPNAAGAPDGVADGTAVAAAGRWSVVTVGLPGTRCTDGDRAAMDVAVALLERRLQRALLDRGLAVATFARHEPGALAGDVALGATVAPANAQRALEVMRAEVARLRDQSSGDDELGRAREAAAGRAAIATDESGARAAALAFEELAGDAAAVARAPARLRAVGAEAVRRVTAARWTPDRERVAIAGPPSE